MVENSDNKDVEYVELIQEFRTPNNIIKVGRLTLDTRGQYYAKGSNESFYDFGTIHELKKQPNWFKVTYKKPAITGYKVGTSLRDSLFSPMLKDYLLQVLKPYFFETFKAGKSHGFNRAHVPTEVDFEQFFNELIK